MKHIMLQDLDQLGPTYAMAACGYILEPRPRIRNPKHGFPDWPEGVDCQSCLKNALDVIEQRRQKSVTK